MVVGVKIAAVQHDIHWMDKEQNYEHLSVFVKAAADEGAQLVVLSEMFATGFALGDRSVAQMVEPPEGPTTEFLRDQAEINKVWVAGSIAIQTELSTKPFNAFVFVSPTGEVHRYNKMYPFSFSGEDNWFQAGDRSVVLNIHGLRVTPFVCYDLRFANEFWNMALDTDVFIVSANWPQERRQHWMSLLSARAIENQCYVVGVNRVGTGGSLNYVGDSLIIDPNGVVLVDGIDSGESVLLADLDAQVVTSIRESFPVLRDR